MTAVNLDWGAVFNAVFMVASGVGGWFVHLLFTRIEKLEIADREMTKAFNDLRVALPTHYVNKDEFKDMGDSIFNALRRIEDKLDHKVDRP